MNKKSAIFVILALVLSSFVFFVGYDKVEEPKEVYRVYLSGKTLGYIKSKEKLEEYIDNEQKDLKAKYSVDRVYTPNNLNIVKEITFNEKIAKEEEIYEDIKDIAPFTVKGYTITIKGESTETEEGEKQAEDIKINVLNKQLFIDATLKTMNSFISTSDYEKFINNRQEKITTTGTLIEDIYIKNNQTIKEGNISTGEKIFTDIDELSRYLLFNTLEREQSYTVKENDTIYDIAYNNKLSETEFLIANTEFRSADSLLYPGQIVDITRINPVIQFVEELHIVEDQERKFNTVVEYDESIYTGEEKIKQEGINGIDRVTKKIQKINGEIRNNSYINQEATVEIKPVVDKVVVKGTKKYAESPIIPDEGPVGLIGSWYWPTNRPYIITSGFGYRGGKIHEAVDISGTGYGSPIYAANSGVVTHATYDSYNGNYIYIDHRNGYVTVYAHLAKLEVRAGQNVMIGQRIGTMGNTGYAFGTHLHFGIYKGTPYRGGIPMNPLNFY